MSKLDDLLLSGSCGPTAGLRVTNVHLTKVTHGIVLKLSTFQKKD